MRLFQILLYMLALTIGGCLAFQHNVQFPHRPSKKLKYIEKEPAASSGGAFCVVADASADSELNSRGKALFKTNCAACHNRNMKDDLTGPALGGVVARWKDYPKEDLYEWIRNSQRLVKEGHPRAVDLYREWNKVIMSPFNGLTDEDIEAILFYIEETAG